MGTMEGHMAAYNFKYQQSIRRNPKNVSLLHISQTNEYIVNKSVCLPNRTIFPTENDFKVLETWFNF